MEIIKTAWRVYAVFSFALLTARLNSDIFITQCEKYITIKEGVTMKMNKLGFLALLALLGVMGLATDNRGLMGFFGFAYYIRYFFIIPDEMFKQNVRQAASIGFFSGVAAMGFAVALRIPLHDIITSNMALASSFIVSVFAFTIVLTSLEIKEQQG